MRSRRSPAASSPSITSGHRTSSTTQPGPRCTPGHSRQRSPSFARLLRRVRKAALGAQSHAEVPFESPPPRVRVRPAPASARSHELSSGGDAEAFLSDAPAPVVY